MPNANPDALKFLLSRRSCPAKTLTQPVPDKEALQPILEAALRTPDHGKLEPWRLIVLHPPALARLAELTALRGAELGFDDAKIAKSRGRFDDANLVVAVIESPVDGTKVPKVEQTYSAGAVCLALVNAALASGWGANWLTDFISHDRAFMREGLALQDHERIAGLIHLGTETSRPPERPRPDIKDKVTWISE